MPRARAAAARQTHSYLSDTQFQHIYTTLFDDHIRLMTSKTPGDTQSQQKRLLLYTYCKLRGDKEFGRAKDAYTKETIKDVLERAANNVAQGRPQGVYQLWLSPADFHKFVIHEDMTVVKDTKKTRIPYSGLDTKYFFDGYIFANVKQKLTDKTLNFAPHNTMPVGVLQRAKLLSNTDNDMREPFYPNGRMSGMLMYALDKDEGRRSGNEKLKQYNDVTKEGGIYKSSLQAFEQKINDRQKLKDFQKFRSEYVRAGKLKPRYPICYTKTSKTTEILDTFDRYGCLIHVMPDAALPGVDIKVPYHGAFKSTKGTNYIKHDGKTLFSDDMDSVESRDVKLAQYMFQVCHMEIPHRALRLIRVVPDSRQNIKYVGSVYSGMDTISTYDYLKKHAFHWGWQAYFPYLLNLQGRPQQGSAGIIRDGTMEGQLNHCKTHIDNKDGGHPVPKDQTHNLDFSPRHHTCWQFSVFLGMRVAVVEYNNQRLYFVLHDIPDAYEDQLYGLYRPTSYSQRGGIYKPQFEAPQLTTSKMVRFWAFRRNVPTPKEGAEEASDEVFLVTEQGDKQQSNDALLLSKRQPVQQRTHGEQDEHREETSVAREHAEPMDVQLTTRAGLTAHTIKEFHWNSSTDTPLGFEDLWQPAKVMIQREWVRKTQLSKKKPGELAFLMDDKAMQQFMIHDFKNLPFDPQKGYHLPVDVRYSRPQLTAVGRILLGVESTKPQVSQGLQFQSARVKELVDANRLGYYDRSKSMSINSPSPRDVSDSERLAWLKCVKIRVALFTMRNANYDVHYCGGNQRQRTRLEKKIAFKNPPAELKRKWQPSIMQTIHMMFELAGAVKETHGCSPALLRKGDLQKGLKPIYQYLPSVDLTVLEYLESDLHFRNLPLKRMNTQYSMGEAKNCACVRCARPFFEYPFYFTSIATQQRATASLPLSEVETLNNQIEPEHVDWSSGQLIMTRDDGEPNHVGTKFRPADNPPQLLNNVGSFHRLTMNRPMFERTAQGGNKEKAVLTNRNFFSPLIINNMPTDDPVGFGWMVELSNCKTPYRVTRHNMLHDTNLCNKCGQALGKITYDALHVTQSGNAGKGKKQAVQRTYSLLNEFDSRHNTPQQMAQFSVERGKAPDPLPRRWPYASVQQIASRLASDEAAEMTRTYEKHYDYTAWRPGEETILDYIRTKDMVDGTSFEIPNELVINKYSLPYFYRDYLRGILFEVNLDAVDKDNVVWQHRAKLNGVDLSFLEDESKRYTVAEIDRKFYERVKDKPDAEDVVKAYKQLKTISKNLFLMDAANFQNRQRENSGKVQTTKFAQEPSVWVGDTRAPDPSTNDKKRKQVIELNLQLLTDLMEGNVEKIKAHGRKTLQGTECPEDWDDFQCGLAQAGILSYLESCKDHLKQQLGRQKVLHADGYDPKVQRREVIGAEKVNGKWYYYRDILDEKLAQQLPKTHCYQRGVVRGGAVVVPVPNSQETVPCRTWATSDVHRWVRAWYLKDDWLDLYVRTGRKPTKGRLSKDGAIMGDPKTDDYVYAVRDSQCKQTRVFITYVLHRRATDDVHSLHICSTMANAVRFLFSNDSELSELVRFGYKIVRDLGSATNQFSLMLANKSDNLFDYPQSYVHDLYDTHIKQVDVEAGIEIGPQQRLHHFHMMLTITHWSKLQLDYYAMAAWLQSAFKGHTYDGRFMLKDQNGLPFYRDSEHPYIQLKLYPEDNYMDILTSYITKTVPHVQFKDLKRISDRQREAAEADLEDMEERMEL